MGQIYIKFKTDDIATDSEQQTRENWLRRSMTKVLSSIIPNANPDFDKKIQDVRQWILEVDDIEGTPEREIGLNDNGEVIMIMPWRNNYGFWTDNNIQVDELAKSRQMQFMDEQEFEKLWADFDTKNGVR